jgi:S1-C subfamily serine protease
VRLPKYTPVKCNKCGQVFHVSPALVDRRAKCRPCGNEFEIPAAVVRDAQGSRGEIPLIRAAIDRFSALRLGAECSRRPRLRRLSLRWSAAVAGGIFGIVLVALVAHGVIHNSVSQRVEKLERGRVARLSAPRNEKEYKSVTELIEAVEPSVVQIKAGGSIGSGFILDESGLIVTCEHCFRDAIDAEVVFANGKKLPVLGVARLAHECDVAILVVESSFKLRPLPLADALPKKGEPIVAFGSPAGLSFSESEGSVSGLRSVDELSQLPGVFRMSLPLSPSTSLVQITASTMPGNSGGPIVDFSGNVLGISSFVLDWHGHTYEFCIAAAEIRKVAAKLDGKVTPLVEQRRK